jgi:hypothetical protein
MSIVSRSSSKSAAFMQAGEDKVKDLIPWQGFRMA